MQWLFNIIFDWVRANFFTQTQIISSTVPLVVAGDPVPDCTGIYFAKGLYNGRLYYEHDHGTYFIWWDALCTDYNLSTGLGVKAPGFWWGPANNIEGPYSWADDYRGEAFVSEGYNYLHHGFVDRGDPVDLDFTLIDLTTDGLWHDLDLSDIIPANAKAVSINMLLFSHVMNSDLALRKKGHTNSNNESRMRTQVAMTLYTGDMLVAPDADGVIQYTAYDVEWIAINFAIKGWWF